MDNLCGFFPNCCYNFDHWGSMVILVMLFTALGRKSLKTTQKCIFYCTKANSKSQRAIRKCLSKTPVGVGTPQKLWIHCVLCLVFTLSCAEKCNIFSWHDSCNIQIGPSFYALLKKPPHLIFIPVISFSLQPKLTTPLV